MLGVLAVLGAGVVVAVLPNGGRATRAVAVTWTPVADTYVRSDRPAANFGRSTRLVAAGHPIAAVYLRFNVAIPAGAAVARATLRLFSASSSTAGFTVHRVPDTSWRERTTNYTNIPPIRAQVAASAGAHRGRAYAPVDVTRLITRSGPISLAIMSVSTSPVSFRSRESASGRPRLVVELAAPAASGTGTVTVGAATTSPAETAAPPATTGGGGPAAGGGGNGGGGGSSAAPLCGTVTAPPNVEHVIWIWMENKPYDAVIGSSSAPYENELAAACGLATNYHAVSHPSLPNYIAATSGGTQGIADDEPPASHPLAVESIYSQVKAAGKTWRDYVESAPGACSLTSSGLYAVKHDPAPYYTGIRSDCATWDVPMGTTTSGNFLTDLTGGTLPAFSFVTPDLCNDTHDCSVATGDAWLKSWFAKILTSPTYLAGRTVIFVTWDEDDGSVSNHIPLIVVNPSTRAGTQSATSFDHYALLKTTEQLLGLTTFLGRAAEPATPSMAPAFNLG